MKKLLLMMIVLLVSGAILAQGSAKTTATKSVLAFHAGPSFPVGDFASNDFDNEQAGFAKTGFTIDLNYGYQFHPNAGIAAPGATVLTFNNVQYIKQFEKLDIFDAATNTVLEVDGGQVIDINIVTNQVTLSAPIPVALAVNDFVYRTKVHTAAPARSHEQHHDHRSARYR